MEKRTFWQNVFFIIFSMLSALGLLSSSISVIWGFMGMPKWFAHTEPAIVLTFALSFLCYLSSMMILRKAAIFSRWPVNNDRLAFFEKLSLVSHRGGMMMAFICIFVVFVCAYKGARPVGWLIGFPFLALTIEMIGGAAYIFFRPRPDILSST